VQQERELDHHSNIAPYPPTFVGREYKVVPTCLKLVGCVAWRTLLLVADYNPRIQLPALIFPLDSMTWIFAHEAQATFCKFSSKSLSCKMPMELPRRYSWLLHELSLQSVTCKVHHRLLIHPRFPFEWARNESLLSTYNSNCCLRTLQTVHQRYASKTSYVRL
jgi:hypothetical protein